MYRIFLTSDLKKKLERASNLRVKFGLSLRSNGRNIVDQHFPFCPCVYVLQTTAPKEIYDRVRTGCKEKRTGYAKFVVFHLRIGLIAVAVTVAFIAAPRIYRCA